MTNPALRKRTELVERALMPFARSEGVQVLDCAADESIKEQWKKVRGASTELPCICVDGHPVGVRSFSPLEMVTADRTGRAWLSWKMVCWIFMGVSVC